MYCPNHSILTFGFLFAGLLLQAIPAHGQDFGWARQFGGAGIDVGYDVTTDGAGNVYVTGYFEGVVDFDPGAGVANLTSAGGDDIFIVKLNSAGSLIWARRMGGAGSERAWNVVVDTNGNVHTTGWFEGTADFDPGAGVANLTAVGQNNAFVSKLDSSGNFVWAKMLGGAGYSEGEGIGVDAAGNIYTAGFFNGPGDFDPGAGVFTMTPAGNEDVYVSKLDSSGNFVWARRMGGSNYAYPVGLALDSNSNIHLVGSFTGSVDFNPGVGTATLTAAGEEDIFVSKLDSAGNYLWARGFGGAAFDYAYDIAVDGNGNVLTTGSYFGTVDFDPGAGTFNLTSAGIDDAFVSKLDASGDFVWAGSLGSSEFDFGADVAVDDEGNVYTTGLFMASGDFDPGPGVFNLTSAGGDEIFVSKLDSAGNFGWARSMGGTGDEVGEGIAIRGGNVYVTGRFTGTADMDPSGVLNLTSNGESDAFVVNLASGLGGAPPVITSSGIVMANFLPTINTVSPLSIISVFGQNFSTKTILYPNLDGDGKLATTLGGACLMMNGEALPIFAVTPEQIDAQVSANKAFGPASFTVVTNCATAAAMMSAPMMLSAGPPRGITSGVETVTVEEATPVFFIFNPVAADGLIAARFNATPTQTAAAVAPEGMFHDQYGPSRPAKPGDIVLLYGTGWGETTANLTAGQLATAGAEVLPSANRKLTLGGMQLADEDLIYVGVTPQAAGLYQAAIRIPANTTPGNKQVVLTVYGKSTPVGPVIPIGAP